MEDTKKLDWLSSRVKEIDNSIVMINSKFHQIALDDAAASATHVAEKLADAEWKKRNIKSLDDLKGVINRLAWLLVSSVILAGLALILKGAVNV